jgi:hypothetical protein
MKRILFVTNGESPNIKCLEFACFLAQMNSADLTGVLIDNSDLEVVPEGHNGNKSVQGAKMSMSETARVFKEHCDQKNIPFNIYKIQGDPVHEIVNESRYSDIMIMDPAVSAYAGEEAPSNLLKEILAKIECPVIVSPHNFERIEEIIFCFDGSDSSIFAMKQFTYLIPQMKEQRVSLLEVNHADHKEFSTAHKKMAEWLMAHFDNIMNIQLKGDVRKELLTYLGSQKDKLVIMGAYGRSQLSQFFRRSTADVLIRDIDLPFFITHYKA